MSTLVEELELAAHDYESQCEWCMCHARAARLRARVAYVNETKEAMTAQARFCLATGVPNFLHALVFIVLT